MGRITWKRTWKCLMQTIKGYTGNIGSAWGSYSSLVLGFGFRPLSTRRTRCSKLVIPVLYAGAIAYEEMKP